MALKAILDSLDGVDEHFKGEYVEKEIDGKKAFVLDVESVGGYSLEDVGGLKTSLGKERATREKLEKDVIKFKDIDPDKARSALEELEELKKLDPEKEADKIANTKLEAAKAQLIKKHNEDLEAERSKSGKYRGKVEELLRDGVAIAALAEMKGSVDLLLPHVRSQTRVVEDGDDFRVEVIGKDGNARIGNSKGELMSIKDLIAEMRDSDTFGLAFEGDGKSGGGKRPGNGGGGNPTLKRSQMSAEEKHEYQQKHGQAAFLKLPK